MSTKTRSVAFICSSAMCILSLTLVATPAEAGSPSGNRVSASHVIRRCEGHVPPHANAYRLLVPDPGATYRLVRPCLVSKIGSTA
jgi:hypothetical protein